MKPGDFVHWLYTYNRKVVDRSEELWSTIDHYWIPCGGIMLLITCDELECTFLREERVYTCRRYCSSRFWSQFTDAEGITIEAIQDETWRSNRVGL